MVLGVSHEADRTTIQRAHRQLARRYHPDFGGDQTTMATINEAWRILNDPVLRASHDASRGRPSSPSTTDGDQTRIDFGRYEGWTLRDIAACDDDYLTWLSRTPMGRPVRAEIDAVLSQRAKGLEALRPKPAAPRRAWGV